MRLHRFYIEQPLGEEVIIDDVSLLNQWTKVFRYTVGDFVILFNGDGNDYQYSLQDVTKKTCMLICTGHTPSYIPSKKTTLCLSIIKKDNFELVVQKATELGVTTIIPILTSRSEKKNLSMERLQRIAIESTEQCGRGDVPVILPISQLKDILVTFSKESTLLFFSIDGVPLADGIVQLKNRSTVLLIGPEGGWGDEDISYIKEYNAQACSLGKTTLRAETAAIAACALLNI